MKLLEKKSQIQFNSQQKRIIFLIFGVNFENSSRSKQAIQISKYESVCLFNSQGQET